MEQRETMKKESVTSSTSSPAQTVGLVCEANSLAKWLIIDYHLYNNGPRTIYVWDLMINYTGAGEEVIAPDLAYVFWEKPNTARVVRAVLNLPPEFDVSIKETPYVRKVQPGGTADGRISLPVPLHEFSPFYSPTDEISKTQCNKVRLLIGWIHDQKGMELRPRKIGGREVLALRGAWKGSVQHLAECTFDEPILMFVRQDRFDRSQPMQ